MAQSEDAQHKRNSGPAMEGPLGEVGDILYKGLQFLASLKITVGAFAFAIFLILAGTLAQVNLDIHVVLKEYFRPWIVRIPLQVFLPVTFFPSKPQIGGWFWFPGGALIGTVMFINLAAAHAVRFKIQTTGSRLWTGIGVIALGALTTYMVIISGSDKDGVQDKAWFEWNTLWQILKFGLGAAWVAMASALLKIDAKRKLERWSITALTLLVGVGVIYLFYMGDDAQLKDESMRILWQLIKAEAAALLLLVGCVMVFKKRAGVVLLHAGIGLMMFSELLVAKTAVEAQMPINEGETVNYVMDARQAELAVVDLSPKDHNTEVVIPASRLKLAGNAEEKEQQTIEDDRLPFKVRVVKFIPNSRYRIADFPDPDSPVTEGGGLRMWIVEEPSSTGTDSDQKFDAPSAFIEFLDKESSQSLGVYLMSLHLKEQTVRIGKKDYEVALRFKRHYKSYSMHLIDVRSDKYLGTDINRNYSSELQLVDNKGDGKDSPPRKVKIWMNNPLRYAGETFYQSGYNPPAPLMESAVDPATGKKTGLLKPKIVNGRPVMRESTTLQVVTNTGWMIPYVACMIVATGMLAHFWIVLLRFLNRRVAAQTGSETPAEITEFDGTAATVKPVARRHKPAKKTARGEVFEPELANEPSFFSARKAAVWFPAAAAGIMGLWLLSKMVVMPPKADQMNLNAFGKLPVVANARTKPFDSLARNSLRSLSARQTFLDANGDKQPAIRWLLDVITDHEKSEKYQVFRVENLEVLSMLGLARRPGYRYSLHEILSAQEGNITAIEEQDRKARATPGKERTVFQRKIIALAQAIGEYRAIQRAFVIPAEDLKKADDQLRTLILRYRKQTRSVPLAIPDVDDENEPWETLTESSARLWIRRYAKANKLDSLNDIAIRLAFDRSGTAPDAEVAIAWMNQKTAEFLQKRDDVSSDLIRRTVANEWHRLSPIRQMGEAKNFLLGRLNEIMQRKSLDGDDPPETAALVKILTAYRDGKAEDFNAGVDEYKTVLADLQPNEYEPAKLGFESWFNHFEPFYHSAVLYVIAFVLGVSAWLGWSKPLNRSAFCLILMAFAIHTFSLIARMYISDRWGVTVTNLYSSAIFIGWAACLLGILLELVHGIGIGNVVAGAAGFGALLIAHFLSLDGDTISVMQAVLDTNFWLATHVTTITLGYATTYIAGILGAVYIALGLFTDVLNSKRRMPALTTAAGDVVERVYGGTIGQTLLRMIYGTLCFAIFFSFVGTVLGGLWADDSWGRFWGWDPKENGALIIVLWNALVLHARWGGMVKDRGMAVLAVGGNIVTSWSWFGVNLLGVGLHSYGFQEGVGLALVLFCASQVAIIGLGCAPREMWRSFRDQFAPKETAA